jgi:cell division protein FtsB
MTFRRSIAAFYGLLFLALTLFAGVFFVDTHRELAAQRTREEENRQQLLELKQTLADKRVTLDRLRGDPVYIERVIRERLGYARPDETVIRFER